MLGKGVAAVFGSGSAVTDMIDTVRDLAAGAATS